jgi:hypothetical protein
MQNFKLYLILRSAMLPLQASETAMAFSTVARLSTTPSSSSRSSRRSPLLLARPGDEHDDEEEEEEESKEEGDWRTFRAKLVMAEGGGGATAASSSSSSAHGRIEDDDDDEMKGEKASIVVDDMDLDGFGALFSSENANTGTGFTPLCPSQWAYDSGKVIEKGAVILGGVEQDFGFGLRQQYFHKAVILVLDHDENTFTRGIILNRPSDR